MRAAQAERANAEAMAAGLGMRLGRRLPATPTPIEAGTFEVHASVVVTYEVGQ